MANDIYTKVPSAEYRKLLNTVGALEKENAKLKAEIKKLTAKSEKAEIKTETKKGGNK